MHDKSARAPAFVRQANENDLSVIVDFVRKNSLYHLALDDCYYLHPDFAPIDEIIRKTLRSVDEKIFIAEQATSKPSGILTCALTQAGYFDTRIRCYGLVLELYVEESSQHLGIGNALLEKAQEFFKERGCEYVQLQTSSFNANALNFYKKIGFEDRQRILIKAI